MGYLVGGLSALILILAVTIYGQSQRIDTLRVEKAQLIVDVASEKQKSEKFAIEVDHKIAKIKLDKDKSYEAQLADLNTVINKLRQQRNSPSSTILPATSNERASYVPSETDICFDKGELDSAQRESEAEIEEIIFQCAKAQIALSCGIDWVLSLPRSNNYTDKDKSNVNIPSD